MKRSFFIKQLQSLQSQVDSLLEATTDTDNKASYVELIIGRIKQFIAWIKSTSFGQWAARQVKVVAEGDVVTADMVKNNPGLKENESGMFSFITTYSQKVKDLGKSVLDSAEGYLKLEADEKDKSKAAKTTMNSVKSALKKIIVMPFKTGKKDYAKNAIMGSLALILCIIILMYFNDTLASGISKMYNAAKNSVSNATSKISAAFSAGGAEGVFGALWEIVKAPFMIMFEILSAGASESVVFMGLLGGCLTGMLAAGTVIFIQSDAFEAYKAPASKSLVW